MKFLLQLFFVTHDPFRILMVIRRHDGVRGARMMGGGFGGCVICLLQEDVLDSFAIACVDSYLDRFGFEPEVILFELAAGVGPVTA